MMGIREELLERKHIVLRAITHSLGEDIDRITHLICDTFSSGNRVLLCGNGGSAADAQHFAAELVGRFEKEKDPSCAIALTTDSSIITAVGNDYGFEEIFRRQVRALGSTGDLLIVFSASGESLNIVKAVEEAKIWRMKVVLFTGDHNDLALENVADETLKAPTKRTCLIQEVHQMAYHIICAELERLSV